MCHMTRREREREARDCETVCVFFVVVGGVCVYMYVCVCVRVCMCVCMRVCVCVQVHMCR